MHLKKEKKKKENCNTFMLQGKNPDTHPLEQDRTMCTKH